MPPDNNKNIYHTLFESHLSYCISVWVEPNFTPNRKYINFNNAKPKKNKGKGSTSDPAIQPAVKHLPDGIQSSIAHDVTHLLHSPPTAKSNLQPHVQLALKNLKTKTRRLKILPADKGNSIVILTHKQYYDKVQQHIDEGP